MKTPLVSGLLLGALFLTGCVTNIKTGVTQNPPPAEAFAGFTRFEMSPIRLVPPYAGQDANEAALVKIQQNVSARMDPALGQWNARSSGSGSTRTLLIEPVIDEIKFISGGKRFWAGAYAGSSAVILRAKIHEKETGRVIAEPVFYARAAAMSGAFSVGGADNAMLVRIANRLSDYLVANYDSPVGGPSGAEPQK